MDAGCGSGEQALALQTRYPDAHILALDTAQSMLEHGQAQVGEGKNNITWLCADANTLPVRDHSVDLIFANFLLPWQDQPLLSLREFRRILRPQGLFVFSSLGPNTLAEWRAHFSEAAFPHVVDLHNLGDALLREGFVDPVLDVDDYQVTYQHPEKLMHELYTSGLFMEASLPQQMSMEKALQFEIVYGHVWGKEKPQANEVRVPIGQIKGIVQK